jgi:hypothetical protein
MMETRQRHCKRGYELSCKHALSCKHPKQNFNKVNQRIYKKDSMSWQNGVHAKNARLVWQLKHNIIHHINKLKK